MSKGLRRYEVLLPLRFNDGQPVPNELIAQKASPSRRPDAHLR
jgi:hypothetical protein